MNATNQVSWNIAAQQAFQLANTTNRAFERFENGEILQSYYIFRRVRNQFLNHEISNKERKNLDKLQNILTKIQEKKLKAFKNKDVEQFMICRNKFNRAVEIYGQVVEFYLKKIGYLPNKEDRTRLSF